MTYRGNLERYFGSNYIDEADLAAYFDSYLEDPIYDAFVRRPMYEVVHSGIPMMARATLYRGLSNSERQRCARDGFVVLEPKIPMAAMAALDALLHPHKGINHVAGLLEAGKSLSLDRRTAHYYGTSGGKHDGLVAVVQVSLGAADCTGLGPNPTLWSTHEIAFLDPRHLQPADDFDAWQEARNRARVDSEILLVRGRVDPVGYYRVASTDCPSDFTPWVETQFSHPAFRPGSSALTTRQARASREAHGRAFGGLRRRPFGMSLL